MKKILVLVLPLLAFIGGAFGGDMLAGGKSGAKGETTEASHGGTAEAGPEHGSEAAAAPEDGAEASAEAPAAGGHGEAAAGAATEDWFKFPNQFFVPILRNGTTTAVMILSLTIEMPADARPTVEAQEHRLRDALLNALMIQANTGGFDGNFTSEPTLERLRAALLDAAQKAAGPTIKRVLIEDIARQEQ